MWDGDAPSGLGGGTKDLIMSQYIHTHFLSLGCRQQLTTLQAKWF